MPGGSGLGGSGVHMGKNKAASSAAAATGPSSLIGDLRDARVKTFSSQVLIIFLVNI